MSAIIKPPLPRPGSFPPTVQEAAAVVRAAMLDLEDDILTCCYDFTARTGLKVSQIRIEPVVVTIREGRLERQRHHYKLGISTKL